MSGPQHDENSVTQWIAGLKAGEAEAVRRLWERYSRALVALARKRLGDSPRSARDEEDVALSVFESLCRGAAGGRFDDLCDRDDLWWLLLTMTRRKAISQIRHETAGKRGGGAGRNAITYQNGGDSGLRLPFDQLVSDEPTPEYLAIFAEECGRLLGMLRDDRLRSVALLRIEGYTVPEMAERLGIATRSVERKLRLIRARWARELER